MTWKMIKNILKVPVICTENLVKHLIKLYNLYNNCSNILCMLEHAGGINDR